MGAGNLTRIGGNPLMSAVDARRERYFRLSSQIAQLDNSALRALLEDGESNGGWGRHLTLDLGAEKVFVKRIPVTDLENENMFSTRNLYDLPTCYNYGVGSAGLGVFRELVTHIKTTNWILSGETAGFPLMYHYRIVPFWGRRAEVDMEGHNGYVRYWGGSANIGRYLLDRANARYELLLFLEHVPHTLGPWLMENCEQTPRILDELRETISFLRNNGIIHFDAHYWNILTDGERTYLTDFGLVLDRTFSLGPDEQAFFNGHTFYDYGQVLSCLDAIVCSAYEALPENDKQRVSERYGIKVGMPGGELRLILLDNIQNMHADGILKLDRNYVHSVVRYRRIIELMDAFYADMRRNDKKDTEFRHAELHRLLQQVEFLPGGGTA